MIPSAPYRGERRRKLGIGVPLIFQRPGVVNSDAESLTMRKYPIRP